MIGPFSKRSRRKKAAEHVVRQLREGGDAVEALRAAAEPDRGHVLEAAADALLFEDAAQEAAALAQAALALGVRSVTALRAAERVFTQVGDVSRAIEVCELALDEDPDQEEWLVRLAALLVRDGRAQEALDVLDEAKLSGDAAELARAEALAGLDRGAEALVLAEEVCERYLQRMKATLDLGEWNLAKAQLTRAEELRGALQAELHGAETVVLASAQKGALDARAGVNYRLLAESLMVRSEYTPAQRHLQSPADTLARAQRLPAGAVAHALEGSAELRLGRLARARSAFEEACAADPRHFAGLRGLGAVVDFERHSLWQRVEQLPELALPPDTGRVIVDLPALTPYEQRVVAASVAPLASALPLIVDAGAVVRLLPIDVRTVDLPEWQAARGERFAADHRAMDALGGVADPEAKLAAARIEELLDIATESGWTFAHELAHLVFYYLPQSERDRALAIYERALATPYVAGEYQRSNEHEFFAVSYQDYLRVRYGLPEYRVPDDQGVFAETVALFDRLSAPS